MNKLILFISEACNLRCRYCYVKQPGTCRNAMMSVDAARAIARRTFGSGASANFVQFFGGEPTLNVPAIRAFVDEVSRIVAEGGLVRPPRFGIVTNGASRHVSEMIELCAEHDIRVTVSMDGPRHIQDALRCNARGAATYDKVAATIASLQRARLPVAIETVYTSLHIDERCSIIDLFKLTQDLGVSKLIFHTAYPPAPPKLCPFDDEHFERLLTHHLDAVDWWFEGLLHRDAKPLDVYFKDLLVPLLHGAGAGTAGGACPAGVTDLSIGPDGSVYSCHLLYGMPQYYLGNLLKDDSLREATELPRGTRDLPDCASCFARSWCQPCGALNLNWGDAWTPAPRECALRRAVVQRIGELAFRRLDIPDNPVTRVLREVTTSAAVSPPA